MAVADAVLTRIRGEYLEMPGLRLTLAQACRLWDIDAAMCSAAMADLLAERFLHRTHDGAYVAVPSTRPAQAKATLASTRLHARTQKSA